MPIKAIIWDLDGTLIYFNIDWLRCRKATIEILQSHHVPKEYLSLKESILDTVSKSRAYLLEQGYKKEEIQKIVDLVNNEVVAIELESAVEAKPMQGIQEVLAYILNLDLPQAVCTLNTVNNAQVSLKAAGISKYFKLIAGRDSLQNLKPHPDHLLFLCNKLGISSSEIIFIGDTHRDIKAAKAVSALSIGLETKMTYATDPSNVEFFKSADYIVKESELPSKLIEIIKEIIEKE